MGHEDSEAKLQFIVTPEDTAARLGSGSLDVLATPRLVAMMEAAACAAFADALEEGETSVGVRIAIDHLAASAVGDSVSVSAKLTGREGRVLHFHVEAESLGNVIGRAEHDRVLVNAKRFMEKLSR